MRAIRAFWPMCLCVALYANSSAIAQDRSARIGQRYPSFGGLWLDSTGDVHVYTTRLADSTDLRVALMSELLEGGYFSSEVKDVQTRFVFHAGRFSYTDLSNWRYLIARNSVDRVPGYQSSAVRHSLNLVRFGVTDPRGITALKYIVDSLKVPPKAVLVEVEGPICTLEARSGILISPRDSLTGELLMAGTRAFAREGSFVDSVSFPNGWTGRAEFVPLTRERAGVYEVGINRVGYQPWRAAGIRVDKDVCHVIPVRLTARLVRKN
jgi:hypothetical protein